MPFHHGQIGGHYQKIYSLDILEYPLTQEMTVGQEVVVLNATRSMFGKILLHAWR
jgi:hypothetical protein